MEVKPDYPIQRKLYKEMKKFLSIGIFISIFQVCAGQISPNETLIYDGSYELSGMMTNIAQVTLQTSVMKTTNKSYLHLSAEVATFNKWDSFFKIRDLYESYVDQGTLKPSLYKRNVYEGGYTKTEKYSYNQTGNTINCESKRKNNPVVKNTILVQTGAVDVITLIYKLRTANLSGLKVGQTVPYIIVFDEKQLKVNLKMMGKETVSAGNLGKRECYKLSISANTNKLKGADKNLIWLTTDAKHIPCLIKFSIPVGVGQLKLLKTSGI